MLLSKPNRMIKKTIIAFMLIILVFIGIMILSDYSSPQSYDIKVTAWWTDDKCYNASRCTVGRSFLSYSEAFSFCFVHQLNCSYVDANSVGISEKSK